MIRRFRDLASREPGSVLAGLFALAFAFYYVATALAQVVVSVIDQHVSSQTGLGFHVGHTLIELEYPLQAAIALGLLGLGLFWGYRFMTPATQTCPDCLSEIPREAVVCRYCTTQVGEVPEG